MSGRGTSRSSARIRASRGTAIQAADGAVPAARSSALTEEDIAAGAQAVELVQGSSLGDDVKEQVVGLADRVLSQQEENEI